MPPDVHNPRRSALRYQWSVPPGSQLPGHREGLRHRPVTPPTSGHGMPGRLRDSRLITRKVQVAKKFVDTVEETGCRNGMVSLPISDSALVDTDLKGDLIL